MEHVLHHLEDVMHLQGYRDCWREALLLRPWDALIGRRLWNLNRQNGMEFCYSGFPGCTVFSSAFAQVCHLEWKGGHKEDVSEAMHTTNVSLAERSFLPTSITTLLRVIPWALWMVTAQASLSDNWNCQHCLVVTNKE